MDPFDSPIYITDLKNPEHGNKRPYNLYSYTPFNFWYPLSAITVGTAIADIIADELEAQAWIHYCIWAIFALLALPFILLNPSICNELKRVDHRGKVVKFRRPIFGIKGNELPVDLDDIPKCLSLCEAGEADERFFDGYRYGFAYCRIRLPWSSLPEIKEDVENMVKLVKGLDNSEKLLSDV